MLYRCSDYLYKAPIPPSNFSSVSLSSSSSLFLLLHYSYPIIKSITNTSNTFPKVFYNHKTQLIWFSVSTSFLEARPKTIYIKLTYSLAIRHGINSLSHPRSGSRDRSGSRGRSGSRDRSGRSESAHSTRDRSESPHRIDYFSTGNLPKPCSLGSSLTTHKDGEYQTASEESHNAPDTAAPTHPMLYADTADVEYAAVIVPRRE